MVLKWTKEIKYTIRCEQCGETETVYSTDPKYLAGDTPGKYFRKQGWDVENGKTVCRECFGKDDN